MDTRDIMSARYRGIANAIEAYTNSAGYAATNIIPGTAGNSAKINLNSTAQSTVISFSMDGLVLSGTITAGQYATFQAPNTIVSNAGYYGGSAYIGGGYLGSPDVVAPPMGVGNFNLGVNNGFYGNPLVEAYGFVNVPRPQSLNVTGVAKVECLFVLALDFVGNVRIYQGAPYIQEVNPALYNNPGIQMTVAQNTPKYRGIRAVRDDFALATRYEIESALNDRSNSYLPVNLPFDCVPFGIVRLEVNSTASGDFVPGTTSIDGTYVKFGSTWLMYEAMPAVVDLQ